MDLRNFAKVLENKLKMIYGGNANIVLRENLLLNKEEKLQLEIAEKGEGTGFMVGVKTLFDCFQEGMQLDEIVYEVSKLCEERKGKVEKIEHIMARIMSGDKEYIKQRLYVELINYEWNQEKLEKIPYVKKLDLALVYRILMEQDEEERSSILITNDIVEKLHLTTEDLAYAMENTERLFPAKLQSLSDILGVALEEEIFYCLTNMESQNGAVMMFLSNKVKEFSRKKGKSCYILPSSVHEVLLLEADNKEEKKIFESMVRNINETEVKPEDRLSNHIYFYDKEKDEIEII